MPDILLYRLILLSFRLKNNQNCWEAFTCSTTQFRILGVVHTPSGAHMSPRALRLWERDSYDIFLPAAHVHFGPEKPRASYKPSK